MNLETSHTVAQLWSLIINSIRVESRLSISARIVATSQQKRMLLVKKNINLHVITKQQKSSPSNCTFEHIPGAQ
jgi:hypothetical protein